MPGSTVSPKLSLTDYQIRRMELLFQEFSIRSAVVLVTGEELYEWGEVPESWRPTIQNQLRDWEATLDYSHPLEIGENQIVMRLPEGEVMVFLLAEVVPNFSIDVQSWVKLGDQILTFLALFIQNQEKNLLSFETLVLPIRRRLLRALVDPAERATLVQFQLQDLSPFFSPLGVAKSQEILQEVLNTLQKQLKEEEFCFQWSVRSFYLFSRDKTVEAAKVRFEGMFFPSKHLILDYKLKLFPLDRDILLDPLRFSEIFLEKL